MNNGAVILRSENVGRHASGTLIVTPHDGGPEVQLDTLSCCHCSYTWIPAPGSGRRRGMCLKCMGPLCGRDCCVKAGCVPVEAQLENLEAGRPLGHRKIIVPTSG